MKAIISPIFQILFIVLLLATFGRLSPPAAAQTPPAKRWLSYLSPEKITALAVAGNDIWAANSGGVIHWDRATGQYRLYSSSDGLPADKIIALDLDATGRLWATSEYNGISYFDAGRWITFTATQTVDLAFAGPNSVSGAGLWLATTYEAVGFFNGQPLPELQASYVFTDSLKLGARLFLRLDPLGQPWLAGRQGTGYFNGRDWTIYTAAESLPTHPPTVLVFDPNGRPWLGTGGGGLSFLEPSQAQPWTTYTVEDGLTSNWITAISFDAAGQPWVGTATGGVSQLVHNEAGSQKWLTYTVADGLAGNVIDAILFDTEGQPWVVTRNDGLSVFDGQEWTSYPYPGDSAENWVTTTAVDEAGQLWIGQANGWVSQLVPDNPPQWVSYGINGPASNAIRAAAVDSQGRKWFGTGNQGVSLYDGQSWTTYTVEDGLIANEITTLAIGHDDSLWVGTLEGISHFDGQQWRSYTPGATQFSNLTRVIAVDQRDHKWFGTQEGLSHFDGQSWTIYTVEDGLANNSVYAITTDTTGDLWVGTSAGVNHIILPESGAPTWTTYTIEDGLIDNHVYAVVIDAAGNKWFGTYSGLSKFDGQNWTNYTLEDGLADDWVNSLAFDGAGHLWATSSGGGISEFDGQTWLIHSTELRPAAIVVDPAGPIWFGTDIDGIRVLVDASQAETLTFTWDPVQITPPVLTATSPAISTPMVTPPAGLAPTTAPAQPLQAWSVAPDGAVFVVDAANSLYQLDPDNLKPLAQSQPLFETGPQETIYLAADAELVFIGHRALSQTLALRRADFTEVNRLNQAGPLALDPGQQLVMIPQERVSPPYTGKFWIYNLADLTQPPRQIRTPCISGPPVADPGHRHLYIQTRNCDASPPHQRDLYLIYDLDNLNLVAQTESQDPGWLDRPAIAGQADSLLTIYHTASGQDQPLLLDLQGRALGEVEREPYYGRLPTVDPEGKWLYLLRERALAVRRVHDFTLQSLYPFTTTSPADIVLSPTAETLYLLGNGWLTPLSTTQLQTLGLQPVSPLPAAWLETKDEAGELLPLHVYPSPTFDQDGVAFLELFAPSERYQTTDGGQSWQLFSPSGGPRPSGPNYLLPFSLSPDFTRDQTLVVPGLRSTDRGVTWTLWSPPVAFTSDRSGNREIYTMNSEGGAVQPLTDDPAADENPAWSPAWTRLAFQSDRSSNWDIFSLRADCQAECEVEQLTADLADDLLPAWSPDGRSIAFVSTRDGNPEIYLMDREGGNQRRLTFNEAGDWRPAWLRDSQHLIFTSSRSGSNDIYQMAVPPPDGPPLTAEPELTPLITGPSDDRDPAVGPDGTIFFLSDRGGPLQTYTYLVSSYKGEVQIKAYSDQSQAEAHPSPGSDGSVLVSIERNGETQVYKLPPYREALPLTNSPGFNGQPATGLVWWWPDPAASREWLATHP